MPSFSGFMPPTPGLLSLRLGAACTLGTRQAVTTGHDGSGPLATEHTHYTLANQMRLQVLLSNRPCAAGSDTQTYDALTTKSALSMQAITRTHGRAHLTVLYPCSDLCNIHDALADAQHVVLQAVRRPMLLNKSISHCCIHQHRQPSHEQPPYNIDTHLQPALKDFSSTSPHHSVECKQSAPPADKLRQEMFCPLLSPL